MKRVAVSVSNDLSTDQRVQRSISVLEDAGYSVNFIGRQLPNSQEFKPNYQTKRFRLWFTKGFLFYAALNLRLFVYLLFKKPYDLYWSNDLDTLLPNFLISRIYRKPLIYDSHEYFCGVPEIQGRPLVKNVWQGIEALIFPRLKQVLTVNDSIADLYERDYGIRPKVLRNVGNAYLPKNFKTRKELGLASDAYLIINQGSGINIDRGMEEFLEALVTLEEKVQLVLVGKGDVLPQLKEKAKEASLAGRVHFVEPLPYAEMLHYTAAADLGISLDKDTNINYRYSLPNKLFDYIKCSIPVLSSRVIEVRSIVEQFKIGLAVEVEPAALAAGVRAIKKRGKETYSDAFKAAQERFAWSEERKVIEALLLQIDAD